MRTISVLDYLDQNVAIRPQKVAIIEDEKEIVFADFQNRAKSFATGLGKLENYHKRLPVVLFMDKGIDALTAMYGTLYAGCFYVPMDIKTPIDRLESILKTLGESLVLTTKEFEATLCQTGYDKAYYLLEDLLESGCDETFLSEIRKQIIDTDIMYLIFTSGSTGVPKGVVTQHRALIDYVDAFLDEIGMSEEDVCGNQAPFYADMSCREVFSSMGSGATLCIIPQKYFMLPKKLLTYLEEKKVTFIAWVPTAYRIVMQFNGLDKVRPQYIKRLLFSGESMPVPVYHYWKKYYPEVTFMQSYGPTEITGSCTFFVAEKDYQDDEVIPIGKPFRNTGIVLLSEEDQIISLAEPGVPGEICVYGTCLAAGYYHNEEKTTQAFVDLPESLGYGQKMYRTGDLGKYDADGNIVFISRKDYQVKHMGKRIELGEIETALAKVHEIAGCCCVQNRKKDVLVLYYVGEISDKEIIARISSSLPSYMIPGRFEKMDELPQLPNGKLDRKAMDTLANAE